MRGVIAGVSPEDWLRRSGEPEAEIGKILGSFSAPPSVYRFFAPHSFLRFHGRRSPKRIFQPNYWADGAVLSRALDRADQFGGFLTDAEIRSVAKTYYRDLAAISHNWNGLGADTLWRIRLQSQETVDGLAGPTAPQPTHQADEKRGVPASTSMLPGGGIQVYLNPRSPFICTPLDWDDF